MKKRAKCGVLRPDILYIRYGIVQNHLLLGTTYIGQIHNIPSHITQTFT